MQAKRQATHHILNYGAFLEISQEDLVTHQGQFVLIANGQIVGFFPSNREALHEAYQRGLADTFSVLRVEPQPSDMGFFDCANYPG